MGLIDVADYAVSGDYDYRGSFQVTTPNNVIGTIILRGAQFIGANIGSGGARAENTQIDKLAVYGCTGTAIAPIGCQIDSDYVTIGSYEIDNLASTGRAGVISAASGLNVMINSSRLGSGSGAGAQYRWADLRSTRRPRISQARGNYALARTRLLNAGSFSSTTAGVDRTIQTHTVTAGTSGKVAAWPVRVSLNIPASGFAAARSCKVVVSINGINFTLGSVSMTAAQSGRAVITGLIRKCGSDQIIEVTGRGENLGTGATTPSGGIFSGAAADTSIYDMAVNVIINTANTGDTLVHTVTDISPMDDEVEPS
jgi:hypothetical protein